MLELWSKQTTVKVLADKAYGSDFRKPVGLTFESAKNECESAQIILTAPEGVKSYRLIPNHIQSKNRCYYIWKDAFTIYNQKYIPITTLSPKAEEGGWEPGLYPDALLPFDKAIEYGENCVKEGQNQAIFVSLKVPKNQEPGEYEGSFTLIADGEEYKIPVKITIWDFEIGDEVHFQTDFVIGSNGLQRGENDYFPQMYRKYVERLIDFKLAPHRVMQFMNRSYNEGADFVREVRYFCQPGKPHLSTIMLPVSPHPVTGIDEADYKKHVLALAEACIEDNVDYFERAAVYCGFIDEPQHTGMWDECNRVSKRYEDLKEETVQEFLSNQKSTAFVKKVVASMRAVRNYVTIHFDERIKHVHNYCPGIASMAEEENRKRYIKACDGGDVWWYTCGNSYKNLSFGIDHALLDSRLFCWLSYDYGFKGTLYWETVQYFKWMFCLESHVNHEISIDCYNEPTRCAADNGDGFLFYPGKPYGIFGPVESIRLHALRDSIEEYEYFLYFEKLCKLLNKDHKAILAPIFERLYKEVSVICDADTFDEARREIANLIVEFKKEISGNESINNKNLGVPICCS